MTCNKSYRHERTGSSNNTSPSRRLVYGERNPKIRPASTRPTRGPTRNRAGMLVENALADPEPETRPSGFCCAIGLKQRSYDGRIDAGAVIGDDDVNPRRARSHSHMQTSILFRQRVERIQYQIREDLQHFARKDACPGRTAEPLAQLHLMLPDTLAMDRQGRLRYLYHIELARLLIASVKIQRSVGDLPEALELRFGDLHVANNGLITRRQFGEKDQIRKSLEWVVNFVEDRPSETIGDGQPLVSQQRLFCRHQSCGQLGI
jgi:hypothetical protein